MLLAGRVVIVSGVGPGLGRSVALAAAASGAEIVLAARKAETLARVEAEITESGGTAHAVPTDVTDADACRRLVDASVERFGRVDGLVNNAFRGPRGDSFVDADLDRWRRIFDVNVWGTLALTREVARHLREAATGTGSIVLVSSMAARTGLAGQGGYAASKGALLAATRSLATELSPAGIRVNAVVPGWMWGPNVAAYCEMEAQRRGSTPEAVRDEIAARIPLRRIPTGDECAGAVVFMLSDLASAVTGQALDVNGGEFYG